MLDKHFEYHDLVELVFDCAERSGDLKPALAAIADRLGAISAHTLVFQEGALVDSHFLGGDGSAYAAYEREWQEKDPRIAAAFQNPGRVLSDVEVVSPELFESSPIYNDFLRRFDIRYTLFGNAEIAPGLLLGQAFMRTRRAGPFEAEQIRLLTALLSPLRRALHLRHLVGGLQRERQDLHLALDALPGPVAILDGTGRLILANASAERLLAAADGVRLERRTLSAARPPEARMLAAALAQAVALSEGPAPKAALPCVQLTRMSGRPLGLVLLPVRAASSLRAGNRGARVLAAFHDPEATPLLDPSLVAQVLGLTATESLLACALAQGHSLSQFAAARGCTDQTARTHLKRVLAKTGARRQAELVQLLLGSAALRLGPPR